MNDGNPPRRHVSFASKLCHFFLNDEDDERYPIYDKAACDALRHHLGDAYCDDHQRPYSAFRENLEKLRAASSNIKPTGREMDRYLWIVGMYMRYAKWQRAGTKGSPIVNTELLKAFKQRPTLCDLDALLPESVPRLGLPP